MLLNFSTNPWGRLPDGGGVAVLPGEGERKAKDRARQAAAGTNFNEIELM
jgi:hypothetical protein